MTAYKEGGSAWTPERQASESHGVYEVRTWSKDASTFGRTKS